MTECVTVEELVALASRLSPLDKIRLIEQLLALVKDDFVALEALRLSRLAAGLQADSESVPSAEEIEEVHQEG